MTYKRVAVIRGGETGEYKVSMQSGADILESLRDLGYPVKDIVVTKTGSWLENGLERNPEQALQAVDVVFVALQDATGTLQTILNRFNLPYTGSNALTSKISANKSLAKDSLSKFGIKTPQHQIVSRSDLPRVAAIVDQLNAALGQELFLKPVTSGSSTGVKYAPNPQTLARELNELLQVYEQVIVEEFIRGKEASVAVLENFRQQPVYTLPVVEIIPPLGNPFYSYEDKIGDRTNEICPGRFSYHEKAQLEDLARRVHSDLHCQNYSKTDFIIRNGDIYFLEVNTTPSLAKTSTFLTALQSVGLGYNDLISFLISTARR